MKIVKKKKYTKQYLKIKDEKMKKKRGKKDEK